MARRRIPVPELASLRPARREPGPYEHTVLSHPTTTPKEVSPVMVSTVPDDHVSFLCMCLHSRLTHHSNVFDEPCSAQMPDGSRCKCPRFNVVSSRGSRHAYRRGMKVAKKRVVDLQPGDRVLTGWTTWAGRIKLLGTRTGAMVSTVAKMERHRDDDDPRGGGDWRTRCWLVTTDLGQTFPKAGGDNVLVVTG